MAKDMVLRCPSLPAKKCDNRFVTDDTPQFIHFFRLPPKLIQITFLELGPKFP
jgi:hypothetical protein